jgi:hypothetical protein
MSLFYYTNCQDLLQLLCNNYINLVDTHIIDRNPLKNEKKLGIKVLKYYLAYKVILYIKSSIIKSL